MSLKHRRTEIQEIWCTRGMDRVPKAQTDRDTREYGVHVGWTESIPAQTEIREDNYGIHTEWTLSLKQRQTMKGEHNHGVDIVPGHWTLSLKSRQTETGMNSHGGYTTWTLHPMYRQRWRGVDMVYTRHGHCPLRTDRQRWRGVDMVYTRH